MHNLLDIEYYYNQANLKLKENDKESAMNFYYMSWQKYYESDSPRIPKKFEEIAEKALEQYRALKYPDLDESDFDRIVYGV